MGKNGASITDATAKILYKGRLQIWIVLYMIMNRNLQLLGIVEKLSTNYPLVYRKMFHLLDGLAGIGILEKAPELLMGGEKLIQLFERCHPAMTNEEATKNVSALLDSIIWSELFETTTGDLQPWSWQDANAFREAVLANRDVALVEDLPE